MKSIIMLGACALVFCGFRVSSRAAQISPAGVWVGEFILDNRNTFIRVTYKTEREGLEATIDVPKLFFGPDEERT